MQFANHDELNHRAKRRARQRKRELFWNLMTGIVVIATVGLVGYFLVLFSNPQVPMNPFPPPTMPVLAVLPESTATPPSLPPTWTSTPRLTETPRPTVTPKPIEPTTTATATEAPPPTATVVENGDYPYEMEGAPVAMANTVFHPGDSCDWQGVAGRVVDLQGKPVVGVLIRLTGYFDGRTIDMNTLTGGAAAWYGESGYEFILGYKPLDSNGTLAVQLVDQALMPISGRVIFNTYTDCSKNLILINFKQVR